MLLGDAFRTPIQLQPQAGLFCKGTQQSHKTTFLVNILAVSARDVA